ncbi:glycosyltransferase family 2 protein [Microbacterium sp. NPDC055357]
MTPRADLVSVIIATNRTSPFLAEALDSVRAQTHPHVEVIVVDDGSPDPKEVAAAVSVLPEVELMRQESSGVSTARNSGAQVSTGTYLAFLDDDDRWHPDRLAAHVALLEEHGDAVAAYCGMRTIGEDGEVLLDADQVPVDGPSDIARRRTGIILPNLVIRRSAFDAVGGFDLGLQFAEDLDLLIRLSALGPVVFEPRTLVDYRAHEHNTTRRHRDLVRGIATVLSRHRERAAGDGDAELIAAFDESIRKNARFAWWSASRAAKAALRERKPARAIGELAWALRVAPGGLVDGAWRRVRGIRG